MDELLLTALCEAVSQDITILKHAEFKLKEWETQPGFYSSLITIGTNDNVDDSVRWLAFIYCKNGVDRYWRKTAPNAISEVEKAYIRETLLTTRLDGKDQLLIQKSLLISKISRYDFPKEWPSLISFLMQGIKTGDPAIRFQSLRILIQVLKVLVTKRIPIERQMFKQLSCEIFHPLLEYWQQALSDNCLETAYQVLKIMHLLTIHGGLDMSQPDPARFMEQVMSQVNHRMPRSGPFDKYLKRLSKILLEFAEENAEEFKPYIHHMLNYLLNVVLQSEEAIDPILERLHCNWIKLFQVIVTILSQEDGDLRLLRDNLLTPAVLCGVLDKLIYKYLVLTEPMMQQRVDAPEEFFPDIRAGLQDLETALLKEMLIEKKRGRHKLYLYVAYMVDERHNLYLYVAYMVDEFGI